jgi:hypothetical protein
MSQVVRTNGDYTIKTGLGGIVRFDTGEGVGSVIVSGNLTVGGNATNVDVDNLAIKDNLITLNNGEQGFGVTLQYAGIEIDRGVFPKAALIFNEQTDTWEFGYGQLGVYSFANSNLKVSNIVTDPIVNNGNLTLIGAGSGIISVAGTEDYENNVLDDDDIPNKKYVDRRIIENPTFQVVRANSRIVVEDLDDTEDPLLLESRAVTIVDGNTVLTVYNNRVQIQQLVFRNNIISNPSTNENIKLQTSGTGKVEFDYATQLNHVVGVPGTVDNSTLVYGAQPSPDGGSGVYFVNEQVNGELISKKKALTFSLIF